MPGVELALHAAALEHVRPRRRKASAALIALTASLSMGGCADRVAQYEPPLFVDSGAPAAVSAAAGQPFSGGTDDASGNAASSDWSEQTYVYRGGRDPKTGLARTQL